MFQVIVTKNKECLNYMDNLNLPPTNVIAAMLLALGTLCLVIAIVRSTHGRGYKDFRRRGRSVLLFIALVLLCVPSETFVVASSNTLLIDRQTFNQSIGSNSTSTLVSIPFNISVPAHNNGTFRFQYENIMNGIVTDKCYIKEFGVYINDRMIVTKQFNEANVQMCDIDVQFTTLGTPGLHNGTLNIIGSGEGAKFYGTTSLSMSLDEPSDGIPLLNWHNSWLDFTMLGIILIPTAVTLIVIVRRRRRSRED